MLQTKTTQIRYHEESKELSRLSINKSAYANEVNSSQPIQHKN